MNEKLVASSDSVVEVSPELHSVEIPIHQELDADGNATPFMRTKMIPPSPHPTRVVVRSFVTGHQLGSEDYVATNRRRTATKIIALIRAIDGQADRPDLEMCAFPILEELKRAIFEVCSADTEGNSRECLRQIRDSLISGGWENYRAQEARDAACEVLQILAASTSVTAESVFKCKGLLESAGLQAWIPPDDYIESDEHEELDGET